jgi:hypothetical protein
MTYQYKGKNIANLVSGSSEDIISWGPNELNIPYHGVTMYKNFPGESYGKVVPSYYQPTELEELKNDMYKPPNFNYNLPYYYSPIDGFDIYRGYLDASILRVAKFRDFDVSGSIYDSTNFLPTGFPNSNVKFRAILIGPGGAGGGGSGGKNNNSPSSDHEGSGGGSGYAGSVLITPLIDYNSTYKYAFYPGVSGSGGAGGSASGNGPAGGPGGTGGKGNATMLRILSSNSQILDTRTAPAGDPGNGGNQTGNAGSNGGTGGNPGFSGGTWNNTLDGAAGGASVFPTAQDTTWITITGKGGSGAGGQGGTAHSGHRGGRPGFPGQPGLVRVIYYYTPP